MLVAVALVTILVAGLGVAGLLLYAREINTTIANAQTAATDFARGAEARHVSFAAAAIEFEKSVRREGLRSIAIPPRPRGAAPAFPPGFGPPPDVTVYIDGAARHGVGPRPDNSIGIQIARIAGVRRTDPTPFLGGRINFFPDSAVFGNVALALLLAVLLAALASGLLAAAVGRYITSQAIRPLIDVTEALQRFAARDFRAQPIAVEGRSDFDVLAHAYNAASAQVAAAFAERDAAEDVVLRGLEAAQLGHLAIGRGQPENFPDALCELAKACFALAQGRLGVAPRGDVARIENQLRQAG